MAITITPCTITKFNTPVSMAAAAATSTTANEKETFELALVGKPTKVALIFSVANTHGSITYEIKAGTHATAHKQTGTIVQNKANEVVQIEPGRVTGSDGKITIELTPALGKKLATDHAVTIRAINLV